MPVVNVDENSIIGYHFHIYYYPNDPLDEIAIDNLFRHAKDQWGSELRIVMWKQIIGPHTLPFFEIDIVGKDLIQKHFTQVLNWVMIHCGGYGNGSGEKGRPVLLHPVLRMIPIKCKLIPFTVCGWEEELLL
ncbi:hypothetical protein FDP41_001791 [Naegleria fowleri]|uniref:Uncharacterized protein n=1 Tax=Naegleria fowleri TaxID=5763 RepID=A0A6A5C0M4_NAEFO|nr:uncharacterized protein FDP41_001791 [Naegleria fowleri]KAF0979448.1 hypothetical protein FDP41_001791 [Naegleria fowleri]